MKVPLFPLLVAAATLTATLAGCSAGAARSPVTMPFTGTWHQEPTGESSGPAGFLAIDGERILFNLDGQPRGPVAIISNETTSTLRSGRLICADGRMLFLAVGDSIREQGVAGERLLTSTPHLDVHCFSAGAGPNDAPQATMRLWPSSALAVTAFARLAVPAADARATTTSAVPPADRRFTGTVAITGDPALIALAVQMTSARADGLDGRAIDGLYQRGTVVVRADILRDLEAGRTGDRSALGRADRRISDLASVDDAYDDWRSQR